jgi:hypothetical protein
VDSAKSMRDVVATTLGGLGLPAPGEIVQSVLLKDDYFVGYKFSYDGGYAVARVGGNVIEFYTDKGNRVTTVAIESDSGLV